MKLVPVSRWCGESCRRLTPSYRGRKVSIVLSGIRSTCARIGKAVEVITSCFCGWIRLPSQPAQSAFDKPVQGVDAVTLPLGIVCVEHSIFCGKDTGIRIQPTTVQN